MLAVEFKSCYIYANCTLWTYCTVMFVDICTNIIQSANVVLVYSRNTTVDLSHIETPANMTHWPLFHNGVAAGLRIANTTEVRNPAPVYSIFCLIWSMWNGS